MGTSSQRRGQEARDGNWQPEMVTGSQGRGQKPGMGTGSQGWGQEARDGNWQPEMVTGSQGRGIVVTDGKSSHKRAKFPQAGQVPASGPSSRKRELE